MRRIAPLVAFLLLVCTGCWVEVGAGPWHANFNPTEHAVNGASWGALHQAWAASVPAQGGFGASSTVVLDGVAYINGHDGVLRAFDASGTSSCSGTPTTCTPLWTASTGGAPGSQPASDPAVDGSRVFVGGGDGNLYAFDAAGKQGCSGTPKTCTPLWTAPLGGSVYAPTITGGRIFVGSSDGNLYALDEGGNTNCSGAPKHCAPLWSATTGVKYNIGVLQTPAVDGDFDLVVYPGPHGLFAFDAAGNTNCSGVPKVCTPQWEADFGPNSQTVGYPVIAGRIVYQALLSGDVAAIDTAGVLGCTNANPAVCMPRWTDRTGNVAYGGPAVGADGTAYMTGGVVASFSGDGTTGCSGTPVVCTPVHTASLNGGLALPGAIVGDVVIMTIFAGNSSLAAFRLGTLSPLTKYGIGSLPGVVTIDAGTVFFPTTDGFLHAWHP